MSIQRETAFAKEMVRKLWDEAEDLIHLAGLQETNLLEHRRLIKAAAGYYYAGTSILSQYNEAREAMIEWPEAMSIRRALRNYNL